MSIAATQTDTTVSPTIEIRDGVHMPRIGLGTSSDALEAVATAIDAGYRLFDTAFEYDNEHLVGAALRESGVARDEVFVTTKFNKQDHGVDEVERALERSLHALGTEYVDLLLIHWPHPHLDRYLKAWEGLVRLVGDGRLRAIGVSNFKPWHLERIIEATGVAPDVNQIELNPYTPRHGAIAFHQRHGITTQSWSPLGRDKGLLNEPAVMEVADRHGRTPAQVVLRWHLQLGVAAIPRSGSPERQRANADVFDFDLTLRDMARLDTLDRGESVVVDADRPDVGH